jgi:serine/threonine-protein kinase
MTDRSRPWSLSRYRVVSKLGAGGMGEVYLAEDTRLNRKVAIKLLPETLTRNEDSVRRFVQEAQSASALNHPNIITVYDIGETDDGRFIVMELVSGTTLRALPAARRDLATLVPLFAQMAKALCAAVRGGVEAEPALACTRAVDEYGGLRPGQSISDCCPVRSRERGPLEEDVACPLRGLVDTYWGVE